MKFALALCVGMLVFSGCKEEFPIGETPVISIKNFGPDTVHQFIDSIYFSINYEDGDGDLGENDTDDHNLVVTDMRIGVDYTYRIKQLVPGGVEVPISGVLNFSIPNTFITGVSNQEDVSYQIQITDRAGHKSNMLTAGPILVLE